MKINTNYLCSALKNIIFLLLATCSINAQNYQPTKVDLTAIPDIGKIYKIEAGEAAVSGDLIKRVEIGKQSAVITYFNKKEKSLQPKYTFRLIDAYGIEVGLFTDSWMLDSVKPGEAKTENKDFFTSDLSRIFKYSQITLPADWATPVYLIIEGMAKEI